MTKVFFPLRFTCSTRVNSAPACATMNRPGSSSSRPSKSGERLLDRVPHTPAPSSQDCTRSIRAHHGNRCPSPPPASITFSAMSSRFELLRQFAHALHRRAKRLCRANLRTDVDTDAVGVEPAIPRRLEIDCWRLANVDSEFVFAQASGDIWMGLGENIGIYSQREPRYDSSACGPAWPAIRARLRSPH